MARIVDADGRSLLQDAFQIIFAGADAVGQQRHQLGRRVVAMQLDEGRQRREQRGMRQRNAFDAVFLGRIPGLGQIFERDLALAMVAVQDAGAGRR